MEAKIMVNASDNKNILQFSPDNRVKQGGAGGHWVGGKWNFPGIYNTEPFVSVNGKAEHIANSVKKRSFSMRISATHRSSLNRLHFASLSVSQRRWPDNVWNVMNSLVESSSYT